MLSENSLVNAAAFARKAIESGYCGECDVVTVAQEVNAESGVTELSERISAENIPCRLSFERLSAAEGSETAAGISQSAKLFLSPEIEVKSGSGIRVRQGGIEREYALSGVPAVYSTHQEIVLRLYEEHSGEGI